MADLTPDELSFLSVQKISLREMFDASGMRQKDYELAMKATDQHFAYGTPPCRAGGHSLKTRYGHCIQCGTEKIAFALRHHIPAHVYIAGSYRGKIIKIGLAKDTGDRIAQLNDWRYGGATDWELLAFAHTKQAGKVEFATQNMLSEHRSTGSYIRDGNEQQCYELFGCGYSIAKAALLKSLPDGVPLKTSKEDRLKAVYDF
ncbi:GIY-YIG nuclease family protein [Brevundimonas mediterranea]|uniref:GIY-YIG nuclease family protein n=1 Tax=Brevundimonas mediterranea TaxID=74329 RepID=A0A7Z9C731_9CAUL|nr:GIY-YIG nuclease family protein [Brevundimonas mediterranea]VDC50494.1 hypothetical protein BREV_BREV_00241 [Brevundimonas mediterranea]